MKKTITYLWPVVCILLLTVSCKGKKEDPSTKVVLPAVGETFYFAETSRAEGIDGSNYQFFSFQRGDDTGSEAVVGSALSAPYGTDGMRASFKGILDTLKGEIRTEMTYFAEGQRVNETRDYRIQADSTLAFVRADGTVEAGSALTRVSQEEYDRLSTEFRQQYLREVVNTSDRSRLEKVEEIMADLIPEDLENLSFLEVAVNLDNDYKTQEYLLMVLGSLYCGSGGCSLFIINENGELLSRTSVVKLPIYTVLPTIEESQAGKGDWNDLFVWSRGMRRLVADEQGRYTSNASMGEEVEESQILDHPERYRLLLDYLEE